MALLSRVRGNHLNLLHGGLRAFSTSFTRKNSDKIYEMRTYVIKPEKFSEYIRMTNEHIDKRTAHSKLCGFWTTELGGTLSEVVHIWEYDSYSHRTEVRKALGQDDKWQKEYMVHLLPMLIKQENVIMKTASWYEMQKFGSNGGIYELSSSTFLPGKREQLEHRWVQGVPAAQAKSAAPVAIWFNEIGTTNEVHTLMAYSNADERMEKFKDVVQDEEWREAARDCFAFFTGMKTKLLTPTQFSPWR